MPFDRIRDVTVALALLGSLVAPSASAAATFYVRKTGNDAARGDGPAVAFATIQRAMDALSNAGDSVVVGPGTYGEGDISLPFLAGGSAGREILILADVTGARTGDPAGEVIVLPPASSSTGFLLRGRSFVVVDGFTVRDATDAGIQVRSAPDGKPSGNVTIRNCRVTGSEKRGIDVSVAGPALVANNVTLNNGSGGIAVAGDGQDSTIGVSGNTANDNDGSGILIENVTAGSVTGNHTLRNDLLGIHLRNSSNVVVSSSEVRSNQDGGILVDIDVQHAGLSEDLALLDNIVDANAKTGVGVIGSGNVLLQRNTVTGSGGSGVSLEGSFASLRPLASENQLSGNTTHGIFGSNLIDADFVDNRIRDNGGAGIRMRRSMTTNIARNHVTGNRGGGIELGIDGEASSGGQDIRVAGNTLSGNARSAINLLSGGEVTIQDNTVTGAAASCVVVSASSGAAVALQQNQFSDCVADGVLVASAASVFAVGNTVTRSGQAGIRVVASDEAMFSANVATANDEIGITIQARRDLDAHDNRSENNGGVGLLVDGRGELESLTVATNVLQGNGTHGLSVNAVAGGSVSGNQISANVGSGILTQQSSSLRISENVIVGGENGLDIRGADDVVIATNDIRNSSASGIVMQAGGESEVSGNTIRNAGEGGLIIEPFGELSPQVQGNVIDGSGQNGISLTGAVRGSVADNQIGNSGKGGILILDVDDFVIEDNVITGSSEVGLDIRAGADLSVLRNQVSNNQGAGVLVTAIGAVALENNGARDNGSAGISLQTESQGMVVPAIRSNTAQRNGVGMFVNGANGGVLAGNIVEDNRQDGVLVRGSSALAITANQVRRNAGNGIAVGLPEAAVGDGFVITDNQLTDNDGSALSVFARGDVAIRRNRSLNNGQSGIAVETGGRARVLATDNDSGNGGAHGLFASGASKGRISGNQLFSNVDTGITLRDDDDVLVSNNLVYDNGFDGIGVGTAGRSAPGVTITNNTVYANGRIGLVIGSSGGASPDALVVNNVIQDNSDVGIAVSEESADGYISGFNINTDGYAEGTRGSPYDIAEPAVFVDADGPDDQLGKAGYADDNYRLQQLRGGQPMDSPGVDQGSATVGRLGVTGTTAANDVADIGLADVGFHYRGNSFARVDIPAPFMPVYARVGGSAEGDGLSPAQAVKSVYEAGRRAVSGMTVIVGPGHYVEPVAVTVRNHSGKVTFYADTAGAFTGDNPGDVLVDAAGGENGFVILDSDEVTIDGFHVTGATGAGIQIRDDADRAVVSNNVVFSNGRGGIEVREADEAEVRNNLVYANVTGGVQVQQSIGSTVEGNTIFQNGAVGLLLGGTPVEIGRLGRNASVGATQIRIALISEETVVLAGEPLSFAGDSGFYSAEEVVQVGARLIDVRISPSLAKNQLANVLVNSEKLEAPNSTAVRNIVASNGVGILVKENAQIGYRCGGNVSPDGFDASTPRCNSDVTLDPAFIDPDGLDQQLGGPQYADDNFHLDQARSPAVDIEPCGADGPPPGSTREDGLPDLCASDAGYHYPTLN